jgi:hypothetical protein
LHFCHNFFFFFNLKQNAGIGRLHIPGRKRECLPKPVFILLGQYKEKIQVKIKL